MGISELKLPAVVKVHELADAKALAATRPMTWLSACARPLPPRAACLVLSGGRSPVPFLEKLASENLDWAKVTVSLADERWVPVEHADSNAGLLARHLFKGAAAKARFVGLYQQADNLDAAAGKADQALAELPPIDVLVLGMGDDGHTASLFPASPNTEAGLDGQPTPLPALAGTERAAPAPVDDPLAAGRCRLYRAVRTRAGQTRYPARRAGWQRPYRNADSRFSSRPLDIYWCP